VRYDMAQEMGKVYKRGTQAKCESALQSEDERKLYCTATFSEDYNNYSTCLAGGDEFCNLCCEAEFGEFYLNDRTECKKKLCTRVEAKNDKPADAIAESNGRWIWQNAVTIAK
jgi:hypothetical protein